MPTALSSPEAVARAVLEKPPPSGAMLSPEQQVAGSIRERYEASGPRSTLEFLRSRQPVEQRVITEANDRNIGIGLERNPDGSRKRDDAGEIRRFNDAKKYTQRSKDFLENGYDRMTNSYEKKAIRDDIERSIKSWSEADAVYSRLSVAERQAWIEQIAKSQEYIAKRRVDFETEIATAVADIPSDIRERFREAEHQEDAKKAEVSRNDGDKKSVDSGLEQFEDRTTTGGRLGTKLEELRRLERELPSARARKDQLQDELYLAQADLRSDEQKLDASLLRGEEKVVDTLKAQILTKRENVRRLEKQVTDIDERENRKVALEKERNDFREKRQQLEEERTRLETELNNLTRERVAAQAEFDAARLTRASQEQDYVDGLRNGFSESTFKYLEEKITAAEDAQRQLVEEEKARTVDPAEKAILDRILKRWDREKIVGVFGKRKVRVPDGKQTGEDFSKVMEDMDNGSKQIMREMMIAEGMSAAEADAKLADPAFVEKMQPQVMEKLITRRIQTGELAEDDARRIIENPNWGKAVIDNAINRRTEIRTAIDQLREQGVLKGGVAEWLRDKSGGSKLRFLLILLGIAALGAGPAVMALRNALKE